MSIPRPHLARTDCVPKDDGRLYAPGPGRMLSSELGVNLPLGGFEPPILHTCACVAAASHMQATATKTIARAPRGHGARAVAS